VKRLGFGGGVLLILMAVTIVAMAVDSVFLVHQHAAAPKPTVTAHAQPVPSAESAHDARE
jgi:hypothetical protein